jgi:molybdate transport system permease protein
VDLFPLWLSLRVASLATVLAVVFGVPLAWWLARARFAGRDLVGALVVAPLVLPPTVLGYYLLVLLSANSAIGRLLGRFDMDLAFTWRGAVVAASVGAIALLVRAAQAGFETVDVRLEQAARTLGRSPASVFLTITLPLASRAVLAGTVLAFCRAFGDFGITLMLAGNIPGRTQTLPLAIYDRFQSNEMHEANLLALLAVALVVLLLVGVGRLARLRY